VAAGMTKGRGEAVSVRPKGGSTRNAGLCRAQRNAVGGGGAPHREVMKRAQICAVLRR
jgi:hypothetical protein